jgi:hypothetical protein
VGFVIEVIATISKCVVEDWTKKRKITTGWKVDEKRSEEKSNGLEM